nr:unnamed protein product [Callosobruchus chinensis]
MANDKTHLALTSDVYFLIQRFLSAGILKRTLQVFNEEIEENNIFPKRIDWQGSEHERSVEDMIQQFSNIRPDYLLHLCCKATAGTSTSNQSPSFLSFKPNKYTVNNVLTNFRQFLSYFIRYHGAPVQESNSSFNLVNSVRGREVSGPCSRQKAITSNLYNSMHMQRITIGHLSAVYCLLFDHSGRFIMTGADDFLIKLWSTYTGRLIASFRGASSEITDIAINSENTLLAAGSIDRILRVWSLHTGAPVAVLTGHTGMITSVNFCPTPCWGVRYLISTSTDGSVGFWTYTYDPGSKAEFRNSPIVFQEKMRPGQAQMICSSFSPGGSFVACGSADHHVRVYYMRGDEAAPHRVLEAEAHSDRVDSVQWAHQGLRFLTGSKDGMAIVWWFERQQWRSTYLDMATKLTGSTNTPDPPDNSKKLKVTMVCWNRSDTWVIVAVSDYTLKLWTVGGQLVKVLPGHTDEIYVLEAHPYDNNIILSAGHDGQLFVWDIVKGEIVYKFLNTVEGQGFGALFDVKWSPDGNTIAAADSLGHILTFGFGDGSHLYEKLPKELFFHTDYRPLVRDSEHRVLDEQTQVPPHLMPPPFLVDVEGNPYPPYLQRLVPGREMCNADQLVPNVVVGNEGTQEVIQDVGPEHVASLEQELNGDIRTAGPSVRLGRSRNTERIRHSTGDWQKDPTIEWKRNVLVPPLKKSILDRNSETREAFKDAEMEEYQRQLRQRPHMISINTSNNIKKREEKDKRKKPRSGTTRAKKPRYEYKEDEPEPESSGKEMSESSGYSDWMEEEGIEKTSKRSSKRRQTTKVRRAETDDDDEDDDTEEDDSDSDEELVLERSNNSSKEPKRKKREVRRNNTAGEGTSRRNAASTSTVDSPSCSSSSSKLPYDHELQYEIHRQPAKQQPSVAKPAPFIPNHTQPSTSSGVVASGSSRNSTAPRGGAGTSKQKASEQYRLSEWLSETRPRKSPYYPQMGDEVVYFPQGHHLYLDAVERNQVYEVSVNDLPWNKIIIRDHEFAKVIGIQYEIKPPRLCCLKLALLDDSGRMVGKVFTVKYHDMPDVLDFLILRQMYENSMSRSWHVGDKFRCMIDDEWWIGHITNTSPFSDQYKDSAFMCYEIAWNNGEQERMSPWDMEPIDPERMPEDESQSVPVLDCELASILYKSVSSDWPNCDRDSVTKHILAGLTKVMELAIAEPFLVPVDINVYPTYAKIIEYPIDLSTIKTRFENNFYRNSADYVDVRSVYHQLVDGYNSSDTEEDVEVLPSNSRKLRNLSSRNLRESSDWKVQASSLIDALWECEDSIPFRAPVSSARYPDYHSIVKHPMDLGTVKENLASDMYAAPQAFCKDMRLIFQNSRLYNTKKRSRIYIMTVRLSAIFEEHASKIIENWEALSDIRKPEPLEYARKKAATDPFIICGYFNLLEKTLVELDLENGNLDESYFSTDPSKSKVVGERGQKSSRVISSSGRENTTLVLACSATGQRVPPLIIFKGKNIWYQWKAPPDEEFPGTAYAATPNGWMETKIFKTYFEKTLVPALGDKRPVLVIYDGHSTHVSLDLVEYAMDQGITILKLPAHTSDILQPLDVCVFKSYKDKWDQTVATWQRQHIGQMLPKSLFSQFVGETWSSVSDDVIMNGFRKAGIFPFNAAVVPRENFSKEAIERWEKYQRQSDGNVNMELAEDFGEVNSTIHPNTSSPSILCPSASKNTVSSERPSPISHSQRDAACNTEISQTASIEQIILSRIQQKNVPSSLKRRKVASGAEVFTSTEMIELLKLKEQTQSAKKATKKKSTKKETEATKTVNSGKKQNNKKQTKKKRRKESDDLKSDESFEDEVPYADTDSSCRIEDEDLDEDYSSDTENKENIEAPEMKDLKHTTRGIIEQQGTSEQGAEQERAEREGIEEEAMEDSQEISVGKWVLAKYGLKKRVKLYVGIVQMQVDDRWEIKRQRHVRRRLTSSAGSDMSSEQSQSSGEQVDVEKLVEEGEETIVTEENSDSDDNVPLTLYRSKTNTESDMDSTSQSTDKMAVATRPRRTRNTASEDEYNPGEDYATRRRNQRNLSTSEDEASSTSEDSRGSRKANLRRRPKKKTLLYESSDSENDKRKRTRRDLNSEESDIEEAPRGSGYLSVSSRGRVRKLTERAKALFKKR